MKIFRIAAFMCVFIYIPAAHAELLFGPSLFYRNSENEVGNSKVKTTETYYDIKLGYILTSKFYLGGIYSNTTKDFDGSEEVRSSFGASAGYVSDGWLLMGHYFFKSELEVNPSSTYLGDSGFQIDVAYVFKAFDRFHVGPQLTYRSISYDKIETNGVESKADYSTKEFMPYLAFALIF